MGFKNYSAIKEIFVKQKEKQKALDKKNKAAEKIAAEDGATTMMGQSRTDFKSENDPDKGTTTFTRKESDDGLTSRGGDAAK